MAQILPLFPEAKVTPRVIFGRSQISALVDRASELTCIPRSDIAGPARYLEVCLTRFAVILVARETGKTLSQIGRVLGGRDHTSIMAGERRARALERKDPDFATLTRLLREGAAL
jgi:chromosomal replication initiation ATPase DnaA